MIWAELSAKLIILLLFFVIRVLVFPQILCSPYAILSSAESATASLNVILVGLTASASQVTVAHRCLFSCQFFSKWVFFMIQLTSISFLNELHVHVHLVGFVSASSSSAIFYDSFEQLTCPEFTGYNM